MESIFADKTDFIWNRRIFYSKDSPRPLPCSGALLSFLVILMLYFTLQLYLFSAWGFIIHSIEKAYFLQIGCLSNCSSIILPIRERSLYSDCDFNVLVITGLG